MKDLKKKFGSSKCFLLTINSSHEVPNMDQIDVWSEKKLNSMTNSKFNVSPPENGVYGSLLSPDDIIGIQTLMKTIIEKGIITDMENKMDELDTIIQNERKGLKNMFRGWGSGTVKKGRAGDNYTQDSIDWKLIMYANMLFMVKVSIIICYYYYFSLFLFYFSSFFSISLSFFSFLPFSFPYLLLYRIMNLP